MPRITNSMLVANYLNNMKRNLGNMSTLQNQLSSGNSITRASDNPSTATRIMQLNSEIAANKQYNSNIKDVTNWLDTTDTALSEAGNVFSRIRELMVKAGNGAYGKDEISNIKDEIVQKVAQLGDILNSSFDGNYIFGGTKSTSKPVVANSDGSISYLDKNGTAFTGASGTAADPNAYTQINTKLTAEISTGVTIEYNQTSTNILEFTDTDSGTSVNASDVLKDIVNNLSNPTATNLSTVTGSDLTKMDYIIKNVQKCRSTVGAMQNRMDSAQATNEDQNYNMTSILSEVGDVDYTQKTMEYSVAQTVYTASLQTSAKVLTKTLLDYL
ncbi:flagellar hook-associated protein FlgL [Clostridium beijerinckii]|uniref:Flagellar hook-associated protein 3 FlgL n=1 Tax=Clostridium beijerinckii TaxID=1520 RepID=A0AAW3W8A8_CLOBE|nr:flagellar hook-associated protein FlgL [Clostridium beijerinckii]MBC2455914.1 flagellar hook-associated protein FlgL [Clostridium beijerinckii]MBC2474719.1 flagellar hook-associated protein FlgL [Clostridium beijerinckii]MDG5852863.1 flagellar hook-associated protein FlgL [Clostridium beijerinckii]NOV61869.1 flagellar hook-associated protein 3 FlgL [Clostridium beijerinckii]NOV68635.1 flagellar hook-associated protein 3 FlgL [Clostridium beijerinckii]